MCGIVGLFCKSPGLEPELGAHLAAMLVQMDGRGPDSAGVAVYRDPAPPGASKLTLYSADPSSTGIACAPSSPERSAAPSSSTCARGTAFWSSTPILPTPRPGSPERPDLRVMSAGRVIEIYKEVGRPTAFVEGFGSPSSPARTASATRAWRPRAGSRPTGSHPFSTGLDLCLVHNGSLSNHNRLRENLRREGIAFQTENDTEVAAGYLMATARGSVAPAGARGLSRRPRRLLHLSRRHGRRLRRAPRSGRLQARGHGGDRRLGGDGLRVPRDRGVAGRRGRELWEPEPSVVYAWERVLVSMSAVRGGRVGRSRETSLRELNQRLHELPASAGPAHWRSCTRTARTPSPAASTPRSRSRSTATSATTAPA